MKQLRRTLVLVSLIFLAGALNTIQAQAKSETVQVQDGKKFYIHKIAKGQSLYAISKLYNVSVDELYDLNPDLRNGAKAGQEIRIPMPGSVNAVSTGSMNADTAKYLTHKLQKGETMYSICRKYAISERQLALYNPALSQGLKEGQIIVVGEKTKTTKTQGTKSGKENKTNAVKPGVIDSSAFKPVSKARSDHYNVALALPFKLEQSLALDLNSILRSNTPFPAVPALAVDFYLGFKKAFDSLSTAQFSLSLDLYDIDDKDSLKLIQFTNEARFKDHDIIFGPLYATGFKSIAKKAKENHIPIVSPITQQNKILYNNVYISKTNTSQFTLLESLADYCLDSLMKVPANLILVAAGEKDKKDINFVSAFRKHFSERLKSDARPLKDSCRLVKGMDGVKAAYMPNQRNIVVNLSTNQVLISDFITQLALYSKGKEIVLCGWESTSSNENIDQEYLNDMSYTFPYQFNLVDSLYPESLVNYYRNRQGTWPGEYYFLGFEVAYYYLKHLRDQGPEFIHHLNNYPEDGYHLRFKFYRPDNMTGFDNRGLYIYRYGNFKLHRTGWK
ncbi:MAG TPA: LysM peptidoglycan-binding domain-containing protein [Bacteroidia bacterium]|nr:LysM peptidoglycan-binding domain-containing protein [Bacteroidia bacterium]